MSTDLPWVMEQTWENVFFVSWPLEPEALAHLIPNDMELDTYEGKAYVSLLPLHMVDIHVRDLPPIPGLRTFPEINLRTYVKVRGKPGVLFISIDASNFVADLVAEHLFDMPYHQAEMGFNKQGDGYNLTSSRPTGEGHSVDFDATYEPYGTPHPAREGSLEHFLVERYLLFVDDEDGVLHEGRIAHDPWKLQPVHSLITANGIPEAAGIDVSGIEPVTAYSPGTKSRMWLLEPVQPPVVSDCIFPWIMEQNESDALFLHWPVAREQIEPLLPKELELDTFEGQAYVGLIPFRMDDVHLRWLPEIPGTSDFPELDFFTFVKYGNASGLRFLSIDSPSWLARIVARDAFHVPYQKSEMSFTENDGEYHFSSHRPKSSFGPAADFEASYRPKGPVFHAKPGSLEHFLVERYSLLSKGCFGQVLRGDVEHWPWPLQEVDVDIEKNTVPAAVGIDLAGAAPIAHFSTGIHERVWPVLATWAYPGTT